VKKRTVIVTLGGLLVALFVVLTVVLKHKVARLVENEIEQQWSYQLKYEKMRVSLVRHFPHLSLEMADLKLDDDENTVLQMKALSARLALTPIFKNSIELLSAELLQPQFYYVVDTSSLVSATASQALTPAESTSPSVSAFKLFKIDAFTIVDGEIYIQNPDSVSLRLQGLDYAMSGELSTKEARVHMLMDVEAMSYHAKGFSLRQVPLTLDLHMLGDVALKRLTLGDNLLRIGELESVFKGQIDLNDAYHFDVHFSSPTTDVKDILALLPQSLIRDVTQLEADGHMQLSGALTGAYLNAQSLPALQVDLSLDEAWFKYQNLPEKVEDIRLIAKVYHPEGSSADHTQITLEEVSMRSGDNFLSSALKITSPVKDVNIAGTLKAQTDLADMKKVFPMQASDLVGQLDADIRFDGKLSDIEQENYADFDASGYLSLTNYYLKSEYLPQGLSIADARLNFTPERINLHRFNGKVGRSDMHLSGYLSNYFSYLFDDKALEGNLKLSSSFIDLNEFIASSSKQPSSSASQAASATHNSPFIVPDDLDLVLRTQVSQLRLDDMLMSRCQGQVELKGAQLLLSDFSFHTLGGQLKVNGKYSTQAQSPIYADLDLKISEVELEEASKSISLLETLFPPTQISQGKLSSEMTYYARWNKQGEVDMNSIKSQGYVSSPGLRIAQNKALDQLAVHLHDARYSDFTTSAVRIDYTLADGQLTLAPFDLKVVDKNIHTEGWYKFNNTLNFKIKTSVKAKEIGGDVSKYVAMISNPNKPLPVSVIISGDAQNPNIKYDTREAIKVLREDVTKNLNGDAVRSILKGVF